MREAFRPDWDNSIPAINGLKNERLDPVHGKTFATHEDVAAILKMIAEHEKVIGLAKEE